MVEEPVNVMPCQLLILRHAESVWGAASPNDFERPLTQEGRKDALRMGDWMKTHDFSPSCTISSPALRAKKTACKVAGKLGIPEKQIDWDKRIYGADVPALLKVLSECPVTCQSVLLVGHNPGLEELLAFLCGEELKGKKFPTAALAQLKLPDGWMYLMAGTAQLISLVRPQDIG